MTILEAIMETGGFDANRARTSKVTVVRLQDGKHTTYRVNLKEALKGVDPSPFYLMPWDVVYVPPRTFNL
jgi:hypothetical protein